MGKVRKTSSPWDNLKASDINTPEVKTFGLRKSYVSRTHGDLRRDPKFQDESEKLLNYLSEQQGAAEAITGGLISNDIFEGKDPYQTRQKFIGEATLGEQLKESYKSILTTTRFPPSTVQGIKSILGTYVLRKTNNPEIRALFNQLDNIQHQKLSTISNNQIIKFHQIIGSRTPRQANSFVEYLRMLFNIWIERGITNNQPCKIKKRDKFEEKEYLDFLRPDEIRRVENIIFQKDQKTGRFLQSHYLKHKLSLVACALIAYQLYSSRRTRSEASKLKWDQVIFGEEPIIKLEKTKTSKRNNILEFAMGDEELDVIRTIQRDRRRPRPRGN